jgi:branched-chain amino acid transport system substrate-binding protein
MSVENKWALSRRGVIKGGAALAAATTVPTGWAIAQAKPLKVGLMLPYSGTFAKLGENITTSIELLIAEKGGKLGGREIQIVKLDDESKPENAPQNADRLVKRDGVDVLIGTCIRACRWASTRWCRKRHADHRAERRQRRGDARPVRQERVPHILHQLAAGLRNGLAAAKKGYKKAVWVTWDYGAGAESGAGFKEGFEKGGGQVLPSLVLPFPQTNFQPLLAQIPGLGVDVVGSFFAGGGAVQFVKEYVAAGLKAPLCGSGFLTEGTLEAQGAAADGIETGLHYGDGLDNPKNNAFRKAFKDKAGRDADVYAVQGYDAAQLLAVGLEAVQGKIEDEANLYKAMRGAKIDSPRGSISISPRRRWCRTSTCARWKAV